MHILPKRRQGGGKGGGGWRERERERPLDPVLETTPEGEPRVFNFKKKPLCSCASAGRWQCDPQGQRRGQCERVQHGARVEHVGTESKPVEFSPWGNSAFWLSQ